MSIANWLKLASVFLVLCTSHSGAGLLAQQQQNAVAKPQSTGRVNVPHDDDMAVHLVTPGRLRVTVVERGIVEASWISSAFCRVKGGAAISWISPDGSMVSAGQPVCQLASFPLQKQLANQLIIEEQAEAAVQIARHARLLAVTALREYTSGNSERDLSTLKKLRADVEHQRAEESAKRAAWQR
jgi:multidrug efflux pump subunit AcrA (membrane-fusion protein)